MNKKDEEKTQHNVEILEEKFKLKMFEAQKHLNEYFKEKKLHFFAVVRNSEDPRQGCLASNMDKEIIKYACKSLLDSGALDEVH